MPKIFGKIKIPLPLPCKFSVTCKDGQVKYFLNENNSY